MNLLLGEEFNDDSWDQRFLDGIGVKNDIESEESDQEETDFLPPPPKIHIVLPRSYTIPQRCAWRVVHFFDEATDTSSLIDRLAAISTATLKQSTLQDFFCIQK